ncbi:MAG: DNA replication/repair protein RecF [Candidatus Eremiobacteraeota bacterium]|nr:DNA replication/repair protein RecF [Candidatus Eremiobacteraeota bacterium]
MRLTRIALSNVRNYSTLDFAPVAGLNVFVGANAQGKSNLLEAISLLGTGKSFRTTKEADLIKTGLEVASISGEAQLRAGTIRLSCTVTDTLRGTRKIYTVNGEAVKYAKFLGSAKVVTFIPSDLQLVSGAPALRRSMLNTALAQDEPQYYHHLVRYQKAVTQKNALLRGTVEPDPGLLDIYNHALIDAGTELMLSRAHFVGALDRAAQTVHRTWIQTEEKLALRYAPNVTYEVPTADAVGAAFMARLAERREAEFARKVCLVGPHRDDVEFLLDDASLSAYGSQGQQRTAVLALKVAEYTVMHERSAEAPLLLLDDVLSELDPQRAHAFLAGVGSYEQAFMTTTALPGDLPAAAIYRITSAKVEPA